MIPDTSFLRRIPTALSLQLRFPFAALAYAIDGIYIAHQSIIEWATSALNRDPFAPPYKEQVILFLSIWSIVDRAHVVRSILHMISKDKRKPDGLVAQFIDDFECAAHMRNKMDHIPSNLRNIANTTAPILPIYGVFSFVAPTISETEPNPSSTVRFFK
jgi:hypothetical protein